MRKLWNLMIAVVICAGLQTGCGGGNEEEAAAPPSGPKAVALKMLRAMASGDGLTAANCYYINTEDKEYLIKTMPFLGTVKNLVDAATKAYGDSVWTAASVKAKIGMTMPDMDHAEENMQCEIKDNRAMCILSGLPRPLNLAKIGDKWLIIPGRSQLPLLHQRGQILSDILRMKIAIDAIIPKIGAKDVSADDICAEVKEAMSKQ
jgi:hypothetical protein